MQQSLQSLSPSLSVVSQHSWAGAYGIWYSLETLAPPLTVFFFKIVEVGLEERGSGALQGDGDTASVNGSYLLSILNGAADAHSSTK